MTGFSWQGWSSPVVNMIRLLTTGRLDVSSSGSMQNPQPFGPLNDLHIMFTQNITIESAADENNWVERQKMGKLCCSSVHFWIYYYGHENNELIQTNISQIINRN